jgi:membrane-associated PAP2 superfamily phosphatase
MSAQPDQPTDVPENFQRQILMLLLWSSEEQWWSLEALVHRVGDPIVALDALTALSDAGLVHRQGKFVFATRAATHYHQLFG